MYEIPFFKALFFKNNGRRLTLYYNVVVIFYNVFVVCQQKKWCLITNNNISGTILYIKTYSSNYSKVTTPASSIVIIDLQPEQRNLPDFVARNCLLQEGQFTSRGKTGT